MDARLAKQDELVREARRYLSVVLGEAFARMEPDFPSSPALTRVLAPRSLPVLRWLGKLDESATERTRPLVRRLLAAAEDLQWRQTYGPEDFGQDFLDAYGWTELIGERGPVASQRLAAGFLMLGPATTYPDHSHQAQEFYLPLAGEALWRRDREDWRIEPPGALIEHRSWQVHAMRTQKEPLLALYVWMGGDLTQKSRIGPAAPPST